MATGRQGSKAQGGVAAAKQTRTKPAKDNTGPAAQQTRLGQALDRVEKKAHGMTQLDAQIPDKAWTNRGKRSEGREFARRT